MSTVTISNSPVHDESIITYPYGITDPDYSCGWHTGLDFAGVNETNPMLYSVVSGEVVQVVQPASGALGVQVLILSDTNEYWRYCHMVEGSVQVQVGDLVTIDSPIGRMGDTGHVSGIHLHLERATTYSWTCGTFLNPAEFLGIPNEIGTIVQWQAPVPPTPTEVIKKKFPWVIYANKIRRRNNLTY